MSLRQDDGLCRVSLNEESYGQYGELNACIGYSVGLFYNLCQYQNNSNNSSSVSAINHKLQLPITQALRPKAGVRCR
jgi:hypothetical protein